MIVSVTNATGFTSWLEAASFAASVTNQVFQHAAHTVPETQCAHIRPQNLAESCGKQTCGEESRGGHAQGREVNAQREAQELRGRSPPEKDCEAAETEGADAPAITERRSCAGEDKTKATNEPKSGALEMDGQVVQAYRGTEFIKVIGSSPAEVEEKNKIGDESEEPDRYEISTPPSTPRRGTSLRETPTPPHRVTLTMEVQPHPSLVPDEEKTATSTEEAPALPPFPNLAANAARKGSDEDNPDSDANIWEEWATAQFQRMLASKTKQVKFQAATTAAGAKSKGPKTVDKPWVPQLAPARSRASGKDFTQDFTHPSAEPPDIHAVLAGILQLLAEGKLTEGAAIQATDAAMKAHGQFTMMEETDTKI